MTTAYESINPSSTPDVVYTSVQTPELSYEYVRPNADVPMNDSYLIPNALYTRANDVDTRDYD